MRPRGSYLVPLGILVAIVGAAIITPIVWTPRPPPPRDLGPAPDFSIDTDRNQVVSLARLRGNVVVIHFVVLVCCSYSALEIGYMKQIEPAVRSQSVVFVSIALNSDFNYFSPQEYRELMEFDWTLGLDTDGGVQRLYQAVETSTFVIDRDGNIVYRDDETTAPSTLSTWLRQVT